MKGEILDKQDITTLFDHASHNFCHWNMQHPAHDFWNTWSAAARVAAKTKSDLRNQVKVTAAATKVSATARGSALE